MKLSIKIEETVKTDLVKIAGEFQALKGTTVTISDAIAELIKFYRSHKQ